MVALPVRREPAPLAVRAAGARPARPAAGHVPPTDAAGGPDAIPSPDDQALQAQQRAFDQLMLLRAEQQREANVIRDMMTEQLKRDEEALKKWIEMI
jgi:hypothetical protein